MPAGPGRVLREPHHVGGDRGAAGRELVQDGRFEVAEHGHGHGPGNGGGGHDQQVRGFAGLGPEHVALFDAEAVLFVHHDQAEVVEGDVVAEQGVGADHDPGGSGGGVQHGLLPGRGGHGAGEQGDLDRVGAEAAQQAVPGQRPERAADRFEVLRGEDLGGGQQGGLSPGVHHLQHGAQGHDGLAGADLALEQAVHRRVLGELRGQGLADGGLAGGQRERQLPVEGGQQSVRGGPAGGGLLGGELGAAPGQGRLEHQGFLVAEPVPGALPVRRRSAGRG